MAPAPATAPTFEELWSVYVKADAAGDAPAAARALREIRRARMERNVLSLDTVGLGLVERGVAKLDAKDREAAEGAFRTAVALAPGLPDGHAGLAVALLKKGPLGVVPSIDAAVSGLSAFLPTGRGHRSARDLATVAALLAAFAVAWAIAAGPARAARRPPAPRPRGVAGPGPGPLRLARASSCCCSSCRWRPSRAGAGCPCGGSRSSSPTSTRARGRSSASSLAAALAVGPAVASLELRLRTARNPLYHAALAAVESAPDARGDRAARGGGAAATRRTATSPTCSAPPDGARAGTRRRRSCTGRCSRPIPRTPSRGTTSRTSSSCAAATTRRGRGTGRARRPGPAPEVAATSYYNLSLAHLQKFEYQAYNEAKSNADRLAPGLVADYDRWKYDSGDYAVVDLGLTREQVRDKFAGAESGVAVRNVAAGQRPPAPPAGALAGSLANRFAASLGGLRARRLPRRGAGAGRRRSRSTAAGAGRPSAATATSGR